VIIERRYSSSQEDYTKVIEALSKFVLRKILQDKKEIPKDKKNPD